MSIFKSEWIGYGMWTIFWTTLVLDEDTIAMKNNACQGSAHKQIESWKNATVKNLRATWNHKKTPARKWITWWDQGFKTTSKKSIKREDYQARPNWWNK